MSDPLINDQTCKGGPKNCPSCKIEGCPLDGKRSIADQWYAICPSCGGRIRLDKEFVFGELKKKGKCHIICWKCKEKYDIILEDTRGMRE